MKRFLILSLGALLLAVPALAQAQAADKAAGQATAAAKTADKAADAAKTATAIGKVSAASADSVTVKGKDAEWTFTVDKGTTVVAKGASHQIAAMAADKKPAVFTEFVKVGDDVSVKYHDMGATKHASVVTVRTPAAPKK